MLNPTCFPSGSLEFWYMLDRGWPTPAEKPSTQSPMNFPSRQHSVYVNTCANSWRNHSHPVWLHWQRILGNLHPASCGLHLVHIFPFPGFALYPFAVINHEFDCTLSPMSPPNLWGVKPWGGLRAHYTFFFWFLIYIPPTPIPSLRIKSTHVGVERENSTPVSCL